MVIDELIERLQKLSHAGFGAHEVMVAMNTSEPRVGFIGKVLPPSPEETNPDSPAPEARSMPWLVVEPTDVDGTPYAPEYLFE